MVTKTMETNHRAMVHPRLMGILLVLQPIQDVADALVVEALLWVRGSWDSGEFDGVPRIVTEICPILKITKVMSSLMRY